MKRIIGIIIFIIIAITALVVFLTFNSGVNNATGTKTQQTQFVIHGGDDLVTTAQRLEEEGIIADKNYIMYYFWKRKLRGTLIAGTYTFGPSQTVPEIARMITRGEATFKELKVTFPEGWTIEDYVVRLNENNLPGAAFEEIALKPTVQLQAEYSFLPEGKNLEGYLFPDTYIFTPDATAGEIVAKMLDNFDTKVDEELRTEIKNQGKTLEEIITLASIVETEVRSQKDRAVVAGIFWNRLGIGQALQSDATLQYALGEDKIKHSLEDLEFESPYNTYKYAGLPPGPVSNPGIASITATVFPDATEYFYFLNDPETGKTFFGETYEEHSINKVESGLADDRYL